MALFVDLVALSNGLHGSVQMDSVALFSWIGWLRHRGILKYWQTLYRDDITVKIYVGKWGDIKSQNSNIPRYTRILGKTKAQIVNLAIVRIKEEQDFIDNNLIKFVEVLYDLDLIEPNFYSQIKYGTNDENTICLIKNGLSL